MTAQTSKHRIVLVPGLFGFARLGGFDYFMHVEDALERRFSERGQSCAFTLVASPPTASIVHRTQVLIDTVEHECGDDEAPIHLVGHSTGGLDVRFLASPTAMSHHPRWFDRIETVTSITTPHWGSPLAQYFTTFAGTRVLEALSYLTYMTLRAGGPPLTILTPLIAALGRIDFGLEVKALERMSDLMLSFLGQEGQEEVRHWFAQIHSDQGAVIQLTPESMDIFSNSVEDNPDCRYGCVLAYAGRPPRFNAARNLKSPTSALSAALFSALYAGAGRVSEVYPPPKLEPEVRNMLEGKFGRELDPSVNDGLVPTASMVWGDVLWAGAADHLDVLGHFKGGRNSVHTDWLVSGVGFRQPRFDEVMDAVADFILRPGASDSIPRRS
jgi:hypothetical protein